MAKVYSIPERKEQWSFCWRLFWTGFAFFIVSLAWPDAMSPRVYGQAAYNVPSEVWSAGFMSASALVIYGLHINGRKPLLTPVLRLLGFGALLFLFVYLIVSAMDAPEGAVIFLFGGVFFVPEILRFMRLNFLLLKLRMGSVKHADRN